MKQFYEVIRVNDIHYRYNRILVEELDKTSMRGSNPINLIAASEGVMEYVKESKLLDCNKILYSDHQAYIVDINFEEYFEE